MRKPVSICMATYNGARFVADQLRSILCQLYGDDEVIISDDGSSDESLAIIRAFDDPRIRILQHSGGPWGPVRNFEHALSHARHDLIFLADQDDVWCEHKVETMICLLQNYDLVVTDCTLIDEGGKEFAGSFFELQHSRPGFWPNLIKNTYLGCCMAFRHSLLEKALPFPPHIPMHDIWLGMLAEWYGRPCFHSEQLVAYRRHGATASTTGAHSTNSFWQKIVLRCRLLFCLGRRIVGLRLAAR